MTTTLEPAVYWKLRAQVAEARLAHAEGVRLQEQAARAFADAGAATAAAFTTAGLEASPAMVLKFDDKAFTVTIEIPE